MKVCLSCWHPLARVAIGMASVLVASPSFAQVINGGGVTLNNAELFVPDTGDVTPANNSPIPVSETFAPNAFIINTAEEGLEATEFSITTNQGNVPADAIFRISTVPEFTSLTDAEFAGGVGLTGVTGSVNGTLSYRSIGPTGASFANIPTTIDFVVDPASTPIVGAPTATAEFRAENFILTEVGFASGVNGFGTVERNTPVTVLQYQPAGNSSENDVILGTPVAADRYNALRAGNIYEIDNLDLNFEGGEIFAPPGFNLTGEVADVDFGFLVSSTVRDNSRIDAVSVFNRPAIINLPSPTGSLVRPTLFVGTVQAFPILPRFTFVGVFVFTNVPSGVWFDPPAADGFEYEMQPRDIPIGVASRVFPGMGGVDQADDAVFTSISGFPTDVDADDTFVVSVEGTVLGEFQPGDTLRFSDFEAMIGDHIVDGGVRKFTVSGIEPAVDASDPLAFPLKLDFNTPTASFEMRALEAVADSETVQVAEGTAEQ